MKSYFKFLGYAVLFIVTIAGLGFVAKATGLASFAFFAPKVEQVRYNTFKQSQAYNDGMLRDLQELKMQYIQANPEQRVMLKAIVLQRFGVYDVNRLPQDLQAFYYTINTGV